jgi:hypothetical protein
VSAKVDKAVLAVTGFKREVMVNDQLRIVTGPSSAGLQFDVWDGKARFRREPGSDPTLPVVIDIPFPYAVYYSSPGIPFRRRLSGDYSRRSTFFGFRSVGVTKEQAAWVQEKLQDALLYVRLADDLELVAMEQSNRIFRDDDAVQPNGGPLFYGEDLYSVREQRTRMRGTA